MKKSHGPAFKKAVIELDKCAFCRGRAVTQGLFHELPCDHCNASGWVAAATGQPLRLDELVTQLGLRVRVLELQVERQRPPRTTGPAEQYETNNRRGAGGTNYTGD